jgi:hypothetical protein
MMNRFQTLLSNSTCAATTGSDSDSGNKTKKNKEKKAPKKQTLRQVTAEQLLAGGAEAFEDEDSANGFGAAPKEGKSYVEAGPDLSFSFQLFNLAVCS